MALDEDAPFADVASGERAAWVIYARKPKWINRDRTEPLVVTDIALGRPEEAVRRV